MGLGTIKAALEIVFEILGIDLKLPVRQTISNWTEKCGAAVYCAAGRELAHAKYAIIVDESIAIGSQKLLLILAVPAEHAGRPLEHGDVVVLGIHVAPSWSAAEISAKVEEAQKKVGHPAEYTVSDGGHNVKRGLEDTEITRHSDISHAMGAMLKNAYGKDERYNEFQSLLGKKRLEYHLTPKAYMLPPNMRTICRFMNTFDWVDWAIMVIDAYPSLPGELREAFAFVLPYEPLVRELKAIDDCIKDVEKRCKREGFSKLTALWCFRKAKESLVTNESATNKMRLVGSEMCSYFLDEMGKLGSDLSRVNISSDIEESLFGIFKFKKSPDKLCGVRSSVLSLALYGKLS
ncbi:hypothetical protein, partial [Staphylococcus aureus]|uniref:hypothetical protein n=1 Tax=Staphylococcus aureus TaxID=1280 RepID=UPI001EFC9E44|nr:hypothetical protein [Staphylococcus aureus]